MPIDIKNLSSQELFELAKRKEKEEQEASQRVTRLAELKNQVKALIADHEKSLAATDRAIKELQEKRTRMMAELKATLAPMEMDIQELERKVKADQAKASAEAASQSKISPAPVPKAAPMIPPSPQVATPRPAVSQSSQAPVAATVVDTSEELITKIRDIMRSRTYISESLLKEKLKANGFDVSNLKSDIDKLLREGKLEKKGVGNYALGKKK